MVSKGRMRMRERPRRSAICSASGRCLTMLVIQRHDIQGYHIIRGAAWGVRGACLMRAGWGGGFEDVEPVAGDSLERGRGVGELFGGLAPVEADPAFDAGLGGGEEDGQVLGLTFEREDFFDDEGFA